MWGREGPHLWYLHALLPQHQSPTLAQAFVTSQWTTAMPAKTSTPVSSPWCPHDASNFKWSLSWSSWGVLGFAGAHTTLTPSQTYLYLSCTECHCSTCDPPALSSLSRKLISCLLFVETSLTHHHLTPRQSFPPLYCHIVSFTLGFSLWLPSSHDYSFH